MPFTGAHPAAVLPLMRWGLVPSALVFGSMVPDTGLFLTALPWEYSTTHSATGIVTVDLAVGLVLFAAWHSLVAPAAVAAGPAALRARLVTSAPAGLRHHLGSVRRALATVLSILLGSVTHVVWDSFTHPGRWGAVHIGLLQHVWGPWPGYRWAQYLSGVLGLVMVALAVAAWWRRTPPAPADTAPALAPHAARTAWLTLGAAVLVGAGLRWLPILSTLDLVHRPVGSFIDLAYFGVTGAGAAGVFTALALSVAWAARRRTV